MAAKNLSGLDWFKKNQSKYPDSNSLADLAGSFKTNVTNFIKALQDPRTKSNKPKAKTSKPPPHPPTATAKNSTPSAKPTASKNSPATRPIGPLTADNPKHACPPQCLWRRRVLKTERLA